MVKIWKVGQESNSHEMTVGEVLDTHRQVMENLIKDRDHIAGKLTETINTLNDITSSHAALVELLRQRGILGWDDITTFNEEVGKKQ